MKLAAIYIPKSTLPHVFGKDHSAKTMNLGSRNFYFFDENDTEIIITEKIQNSNFINNFFDENLGLISAVVGQNAAGKTSLLRAMNNSRDISNKKLVYIIEYDDSEKLTIINETNITIKILIDLEFEIVSNKIFEPLFYSPCLDFDLKDSYSPISLVNYFDEDLENYFIDSVIRNISLMNNEIIEDIKNIYDDFPSYDTVSIQIKKHRKSKFRAPYLEANFGNPHKGDVLKNELTGFISDLENNKSGKSTYTNEDIIDLSKRNIAILESESFTEQFNKLWGIDDYDFIDDSGYDYIHNSDSFIKNMEVTILSYLLLGAVFPKTGLGGGIEFSRITQTVNFKERLDLFLEMYLANEEKIITQSIIGKLKGIKVEETESIIALIKNDKFVKTQGVELQPIKNRMITHCESFKEILNYYQYILDLTQQSFLFKNNTLIFNVKDTKQVILFNEFVFKYKYILNSLGNIPTSISLFDFFPDKKLSTGEKSILDLYSSIYNYIDINKESNHTSHEFYLLLLDEPDLGFQPLWKKKFINAISKTLPLLFSKITPYKYDSEKGEYISLRKIPFVQIIFTTHDPLTLSDIPNSSVTYLKKDKETSVLLDNIESDKKSFGANISDLLSDSFFLADGLIGEFAKEKIQDSIEYIKSAGTCTPKKWITSSDDVKKVLDQIGEPYLRDKLNDMFLETFSDYKELEINKLIEKINRLRNDSTSGK
ncbi:hypothetical protein [Flavobacterium sp. ZS1P14]|uniref:hypothetical protein n=1 Tax=Flavobacterium sp. ZS1P14 TaxID=3401729 RepID=UPI003AAB4878